MQIPNWEPDCSKWPADVELVSSSSNEEADTNRLNKAEAELGSNTSSSEDDEPCLCKENSFMRCTSSVCINDEPIGDARMTSHKTAMRIPPTTEVSSSSWLTPLIVDLRSRLAKLDWAMGPDTWFNGEVKHRLPRDGHPRESEHVDIKQVHEPSEPESLVSNDPTALPGIAVFLPSDHLAPECTPPSTNTARRLARNGNIDDLDIPEHVDEEHVDTDVDMMGLVDSESESEYGDNGNIDPTSSSDSEDRHGSDLVSPPVTDDGRCGASTKSPRPNTDRP